MIKSILLTIYVLVGAVIFCHNIYDWYKESDHGLDTGEILLAISLAAVWPIVAPFWIWFKVDDYIWKKNYVDIISGRKKWN